MNLTTQFQSFRRNFSTLKQNEQEALIMPDASGTAKQWLDPYKAIRDDIRNVVGTLDKIEQMQTQKHNTAFEKALNNEISTKYNELQQQLNRTNNDIKRFQSLSLNDQEFKRLHEPLIKSLRTALSRTSTRFRMIQSKFLETISKDQKPAQNLDFNQMDQQTQQYYLQMQREVQDDKKEMMNVCKSINELVDLVGQMCEKIYEAGSLIDRIDNNLTEAETNFEDGVQFLQKARQTQKQVGCLRSTTYGILLADIIMIIVMGCVKVKIPKK